MSEVSDWNRKIIEEFRANEGRVGGPFKDLPLLLLHSTGARSRQERINPLAFLPAGDGFAVFASKGGSPTNPDWYHNLRAHPEASVEVGTVSHTVRAREAEGDERDRFFDEMKSANPGFADYERQTDRVIPVVILDPVG